MQSIIRGMVVLYSTCNYGHIHILQYVISTQTGPILVIGTYRSTMWGSSRTQHARHELSSIALVLNKICCVSERLMNPGHVKMNLGTECLVSNTVNYRHK